MTRTVDRYDEIGTSWPPTEYFTGEQMNSNPLSSAALRLELPAQRSVESASAARPFVLRFAQQLPRPRRPEYRYSPELQIALDPSGRPLIETMDKDVLTKRHSDGDEGPEEEYDWEEL
jgi:putative ATP-grasp target RiPP